MESLSNPTEENARPAPGKYSPKTILSFLKEVFFMATYDLVIWFFNMVIHTFFRDIRLRGTFNIPNQGACIFVIAPHHNQFVDPLVVMSTVRESSGRRISLLTAAKSYRKLVIGFAARLCSAIPVERAQDLFRPAEGTISIENFGKDNDNVVVVGKDTRFTRDTTPKGLLGLPDHLGNAVIESIESDTRIRLKKPFKVNFEKPTAKDEAAKKLLAHGTSFVVAPHVDNHQVFQNVFDHLNHGRVLGIFPEGGLHDRPTLLPLKPGVAIMALGAVAQSKDPNQIVNVIPVGLNYFHAHKFRLRVVVEFGKAIRVSKKDGVKYEHNSRDVANKLLELITLRLKEVTVTCDDYDTLMAVQAARRLYTSGNRENIPLPLVVEMNRRLMRGYQEYSDRPDVQALRKAVGAYNKKLMRMELHDHQVESLTRSNRVAVFGMFVSRLFKVLLFMGLSMPGVFMFSPVFITARRISRQKAKEALAGSAVKIKAKDVIGTWKILVALGLAPMLYIFWAAVATLLLRKTAYLGQVPVGIMFVACYLWSVLTTYASLRVGEIGVDYYKSLKPLFYSVMLHHWDVLQIEDLKETRRELAKQVVQFCDRYGPLMFDDYDKFYKNYNEASENASDLDEVLGDIREDEGQLTRSLSFSLINLANIPIFSMPADERYESEKETERPERQEKGPERDESDGELEIPQTDGAKVRLRRAMKNKTDHWD